jgi:hypothetical protein
MNSRTKEVLAEFDASDWDQHVEFSSDDDSDLEGSGPNCVTSYITTSLSACNDRGLIWMWGVSTLTQNHPRTPQCPAQSLLGLGHVVRHLHLPSYSHSNSGALAESSDRESDQGGARRGGARRGRGRGKVTKIGVSSILNFLVTMATTNLVTNCPKMKSTYLGTCMNKIIICEQDTLKSTARGSQNKQNCLRHVPLTSVKKKKKLMPNEYDMSIKTTYMYYHDPEGPCR